MWMQLALAALAATAGLPAQQTPATPASQVTVVERADLDAVHGRLVWPLDASGHDADGRRTLAALAARALVAGGSREQPELVFARALEELGASVALRVERDRLLLDVVAPPEHAARTGALLAELLADPAFGDASVKRARGALLQQLEDAQNRLGEPPGEHPWLARALGRATGGDLDRELLHTATGGALRTFVSALVASERARAFALTPVGGATAGEEFVRALPVATESPGSAIAERARPPVGRSAVLLDLPRRADFELILSFDLWADHPAHAALELLAAAFAEDDRARGGPWRDLPAQGRAASGGTPLRLYARVAAEELAPALHALEEWLASPPAPSDERLASAAQRLEAERSVRAASAEDVLAALEAGLPVLGSSAGVGGTSAIALASAWQQAVVQGRLRLVVSGPAARVRPLLAPGDAESRAGWPTEVRRPRAQPPTTDAARAVAERLLERLGGRAAWAALATLESEALVEIPNSDDPIRLLQRTDLRRRCTYLLQSAGDASVAVVLCPDAAWSTRDGARSDLPRDRGLELWSRQLRALSQVLRDLAADDSPLTATLTRDGALQLHGPDSRWCRLELDAEGRPTTLTYRPDGAERDTLIAYDNWEVTDGYHHPRRIHLVNQAVMHFVERFTPNAAFAEDPFR